MSTQTLLLPAALIAGLATTAVAEQVMVEINCTVEYNQISVGPLANVNAGDDATYTFMLDSDVYTDSGSFNTRGYHIDQSSWQLLIGSETLGLQDPFPGIPYFVLRNDDPAVDGFFWSDNVDWNFPGLNMDEVGQLGQFASSFSVGYEGDTLSSLDILDAVGDYDYDGLTSFLTTIDDGWFKGAAGLEFVSMSISAVPGPAAFFALAPLGLIGRRRRA